MVSLDELAVEISELVESYAEDVIKAMAKVLDETAEKVLTYIQSKAPRSGMSYGFADSSRVLKCSSDSYHLRREVHLNVSKLTQYQIDIT